MCHNDQTINNDKLLYPALVVALSVTLFSKICLGVDEAKRSTPGEQQAPSVSREITKDKGQLQTGFVRSENARAEKEGIESTRKGDNQEHVIAQVLATGINTDHAVKAIQMQAEHAIEYFKNQADHVVAVYGILYAALGFGIGLVISIVGVAGFRSVNERFTELRDNVNATVDNNVKRLEEAKKVQQLAVEEMTGTIAAIHTTLDTMQKHFAEAQKADETRLENVGAELKKLKSDFVDDCGNIFQLANCYAAILLADEVGKFADRLLSATKPVQDEHSTDFRKLTLSLHLETIDTLIETYKGRDEKLLARAYGLRGLAQKRLGKYRAALQSLEEALVHAPTIATYHYNAACYACLSDDIENSIKHLSDAIRLDVKFIRIAKEDDDFDGIRTNPQFIELTQE